jgi:hypothetical protein
MQVSLHTAVRAENVKREWQEREGLARDYGPEILRPFRRLLHYQRVFRHGDTASPFS